MDSVKRNMTERHEYKGSGQPNTELRIQREKLETARPEPLRAIRPRLERQISLKRTVALKMIHSGRFAGKDILLLNWMLIAFMSVPNLFVVLSIFTETNGSEGLLTT